MTAQHGRLGWGVRIFAFALVLVAGFGIYAWIAGRPEIPPPFEISNFFGTVEVFSHKENKWIPARRGQLVGVKDRIRTGFDSEVDFLVPDQINLRIKEDSVVEVKGPRLFEKGLTFRLYLKQGALLASTFKDFTGKSFEISSPILIATAAKGTVFRPAIEWRPESRKGWVGVLRGVVKVRPNSLWNRKWVILRGLQKTFMLRGGLPSDPVRVSRDDWNEMKEAYELVDRSAAFEARQMDLSKEAGNFFEYVFDHGTFFAPKVGYAIREFIKDEKSGEVHLEMEYDVFPLGSFVGMYMKTRDFDLNNFEGLEFQVRRAPNEGFPDSVRIEMKDRYSVVRAFAPKNFRQQWQIMKLPFQTTRGTPVTEMTIVVLNDKAGEHKKGVLHFRNFRLIRKDLAAKRSAEKQTVVDAVPTETSAGISD